MDRRSIACPTGKDVEYWTDRSNEAMSENKIGGMWVQRTVSSSSAGTDASVAVVVKVEAAVDVSVELAAVVDVVEFSVEVAVGCGGGRGCRGCDGKSSKDERIWDAHARSDLQGGGTRRCR